MEPESNMTAVERSMNKGNRFGGSYVSNQISDRVSVGHAIDSGDAGANQRWMENGSANIPAPMSPNHKSAMRASETPREPMTLQKR